MCWRAPYQANFVLSFILIIETLSLSQNFLAGPIPAQLGNLGNLTSLELQTNNLDGTIPSELGLIQPVQTMNFAGNPSLAGAMPAEICANREPAGALTELLVGCSVQCTCCSEACSVRKLKDWFYLHFHGGWESLSNSTLAAKGETAPCHDRKLTMQVLGTSIFLMNFINIVALHNYPRLLLIC